MFSIMGLKSFDDSAEWRLIYELMKAGEDSIL
jgi:hypothetical protein